MRIEDVAAEVRPRGHWEAVDLGFALTRRYFPRLLLAWIIVVWPLWAVLLGLSRWVPVGLILFVIWWLKPLYGRIPLFILSRAMFGEVPTIGQVIRAWPGMLKHGIGHALFMDRLNLQRGLSLPVTMLEGLKGGTRKQRVRIILTHSGSTGSTLGLLCSTYEFMLIFGIFGLVQMLIPDGLKSDYFELLFEAGFVGEIPGWLLWSFIGSWLVAVSLIEQFYIGGSFGLYLNCRTQTEGWDVEIAFRRMARRFGMPLIAAASLSFLVAQGSAQDLEAAREEHQSVAEERAERKAQISDTLAHEDFKIHKVKRRVPKDLARHGSTGLEGLGTVLFWICPAALVGWLAYWIAKNFHTLRSGAPAADAPARRAGPRVLMGMDLAPESLPDDILAAARQRWTDGDAHGALSLLYRGALSWLVNSASLPLRDSDTEGDCLVISRSLPEAEKIRYFATLTASWVNVAYAGRAPRSDEMHALLGSWPFAGKAER